MTDSRTMMSFSNQTYDQIEVGASVTVNHCVTRDEVELLALVSGDVSVLTADIDGVRPGQQLCEGVSAEALIHGLLKRRLAVPK